MTIGRTASADNSRVQTETHVYVCVRARAHACTSSDLYLFVRHCKLLLQSTASLQGNAESLPHLKQKAEQSQQRVRGGLTEGESDPVRRERYLLVEGFVMFKK